MAFSVVMYGCESWTIKKAENQRIDAFELWCWRRLLRVPWTARRSNQSILKEIRPEYSLEGLMLKLKLQYYVHLMGRTDSSEKTLMLGTTEGGRRRGQQRMRWLDGMTDSMDMSLGKLWWWTGRPGVLRFMGSQGSDMTEWLNWRSLDRSKKLLVYLFMSLPLPWDVENIVPFICQILWLNTLDCFLGVWCLEGKIECWSFLCSPCFYTHFTLECMD